MNEYLCVVHGVLPETEALTAYRREGRRPEFYGQKLIRCPHCRESLTHVHRDTRVEIYQFPKNRKILLFPCQTYKKCTHCKEIIGIVMR